VSTRRDYLPGLNGLRFIAALFVLVSHAYETVVKIGWAPEAVAPAAFNRGRGAVDFFFTLSGFLITYLLIREAEDTDRVSLRDFYVRRMVRIWPLYFLVLALGFGLFAVAYPLVTRQPYFDFDPATGLLLYVFFLPNLMASLHRVGVLNPLWSIGVEEQFYLGWAPLVKLARRAMLRLILGSIAVSVAFAAATDGHLFTSDPGLTAFFHTLRFQYMAIGALFAWVLAHRREAYTRSFLATPAVQTAVIAVLAGHYLFGTRQTYLPWYFDPLLAVLYGVLIMSVSIVPRRVLSLEWQPLSYLGQISYGIYMYHMTVDYLLRPAAGRLHMHAAAPVAAVLYAAVLLSITVAVAAFSYRFFERPFLRIRRAPARPAAEEAGVVPPPQPILQGN
jgi:peptidoglycan/LPS O-acetylase OafA/YrhL